MSDEPNNKPGKKRGRPRKKRLTNAEAEKAAALEFLSRLDRLMLEKASTLSKLPASEMSGAQLMALKFFQDAAKSNGYARKALYERYAPLFRAHLEEAEKHCPAEDDAEMLRTVSLMLLDPTLKKEQFDEVMANLEATKKQRHKNLFGIDYDDEDDDPIDADDLSDES